ncbi:MAG: flavodoxin family protein [Lachnospiraceae bacterium]|nr:flavodoxin family protein [Lachnospiraceae bacterium]
MKVSGINSSARKDGNTAILMEKVFEALNKEGIETEMIQLSGKIIEPCKACWACGGKRNCVHKKDQFQDIFEKMTQADGIILGSPVYTANISANMQALLERASVVTDMNRKENLFQHKVGAAITAARRGGALNALDAMNHFFMLQNMFIVGSTYWPMAYGQMPGDVQKDEEGLATMSNLGQNMAYLLKALEERRQ